jgi:hypothetical protein
MNRIIVMIAAALTAAVPAQPRAQGQQPVPAEPVPVQPAPAEPVPVPPAQAQPAPAPKEKQNAFEISFQGQIGAGKTTGEFHTDTDLVYGAILGFHFNGPLGLEVDYQHAENDVSGTSGRSSLTQDGVFGHVRFDFAGKPVTPFVYAGGGWVHYKAKAALNDEKVDHFVVPAGLGVEFHIRPVVLGARGEYQWNTSAVGGKHFDFWKLVGTVGFRFP